MSSSILALSRLRAILNCLYHALEPTWFERLRTGGCHYQDGCEEPWTWRRHARANLSEAWKLASFAPLDADDRSFHQITAGEEL